MFLNKQIYSLTQGVRGWIGLSVALGLCLFLLSFMQIILIGRIIDWVRADVSLPWWAWPVILGIFGIIFIFRSAFTWFAQMTTHRVTSRTKLTLRDRLYTHIQRLGPGFLNEERTGALVNTVVEGIESMEDYFGKYIPQLLLSYIVPIIALSYIAFLDWVTAVALLVVQFLVPPCLALLRRTFGSIGNKFLDAVNALSAVFLDTLQGLPTLKMFNRSRDYAETVRWQSEKLRWITMDRLFVNMFALFFVEWLSVLSTIVIACGFAFWRLQEGVITLGMAFMIVLLSLELIRPLLTLRTSFQTTTGGPAAARHILALLETKPLVVEHHNAVPPATYFPRITLENVRFSYEMAEVARAQPVPKRPWWKFWQRRPKAAPPPVAPVAVAEEIPSQPQPKRPWWKFWQRRSKAAPPPQVSAAAAAQPAGEEAPAEDLDRPASGSTAEDATVASAAPELSHAAEPAAPPAADDAAAADDVVVADEPTTDTAPEKGNAQPDDESVEAAPIAPVVPEAPAPTPEPEPAIDEAVTDAPPTAAPDAEPEPAAVAADEAIAVASNGHAETTNGVRSHDPQFALDNVSLKIEPGETIAIVGPSGAGKSTIVNLLFRFYDPQAGKITLGGHLIEYMPLDWLRGQMTLVAQDPHLFYGSIADNLRIAKPDATPEEMEAVAQAAQIHAFIATLPDGYDTPIGERGLALSGGQAQRLALARALLKDAPIIILDEATSQVDAETEAAIQRELARMTHDKTVLVVAHRLSTIRNADRIIVLDEGNLLEVGTHADLLARNGLYARLVAAQRTAAMPPEDEW